MRYLIAYDIADPKRLQRVARFLERHAQRCQKSVFLFETPYSDAVIALLEGIVPIIDLKEDCVQAWKLSKDQPPEGISRGTPAKTHPACIIIDSTQVHFLGEKKP